MIRCCALCGVAGPIYTRGRGKRKWFCSTRCQRENYLSVLREHYRKNREKRSRDGKEKRRVKARDGSCLRCGAVVPFRSQSGKQPGFCSSKCRRQRKRNTYQAWVAANRDHLAVSGASARKAYKEKHPDYFRQRYARDREKLKRKAQEWYRANTERAAERQRVYVKAHHEQVRATGRRSANKRRAIKKRVFVEVVDPRTVFTRDKGICGICKLDVDPMSKWEVDHIVPISKGGPHSYANVQLAHRRCNRSKAAKVA